MEVAIRNAKKGRCFRVQEEPEGNNPMISRKTEEGA